MPCRTPSSRASSARQTSPPCSPAAPLASRSSTSSVRRFRSPLVATNCSHCHATGTQPFGPLTLLTRPPVLIPRPETEDWALRLAHRLAPNASQPITLLDLCTGSACIPLLLCAVWPRHSVRAYGVDVSPDAIQLARDNAALCGLSGAYEPLLADIRDPAFLVASGPSPPFDVITSNPPYIPRREYDQLSPSVKNYEDARALLGDPDPGHEGGRGLTFYRSIAKLIACDGVLSDTGVVAVEVGHDQAREVEQILQREGRLPHTEIWKDPWDVERVVFASRHSRA